MRRFACVEAHLTRRSVAVFDLGTRHAGTGSARSRAISDRSSANSRRGNRGLGDLGNSNAPSICTRTGEGRARAKARDVKLGRKPKLTLHQKREAIARREGGDETLAEIGRSYNVIGWTISRL
jgi:hypothetical protein